MLRAASGFKGLSIAASDGDIGSVKDLYFDDLSWTIRYLVVDTGTWLPGRQVLISPALGAGRRDRHGDGGSHARAGGEQPAGRSRQAGRSPAGGGAVPLLQLSLLLGRPVSLGSARLSRHPAGAGAGRRAIRSSRRWPRAIAKGWQGDPSLRSARDVTGYYIAARDGDIGHVDDFLVDDRAWAIRYLVVDTRNWWPGKKVVLSPEWIETVSWPDSRVYVDLRTDEIKAAPEYDPDAALRPGLRDPALRAPRTPQVLGMGGALSR